MHVCVCMFVNHVRNIYVWLFINKLQIPLPERMGARASAPSSICICAHVRKHVLYK